MVEVEAAIENLPDSDQRALLQKLSRRIDRGAVSCYDLVRDLFEDPALLGSSGLGDLSTNKRYFDDYGK